MGHVEPRNMPAGVQSNIWSDLFTAAPAEANRHSNRGWNTVLSVPNVLYFDVPYAPHPLERGYVWPARGTDSFKVFSFMPDNLVANAAVMTDTRNQGTTARDTEALQAGRGTQGIQGQLWSETVRSDRLAQYMLFPRVLALAERAWHRAPWEPAYRAGATYSYDDGAALRAEVQNDWRRFAARMPAQLRQLEQAGIHYRLAPPGARIVGGRLEAVAEFATQPIEYRIGNGGWQLYTGPVPIRGRVELRTRTFDRSRSSRVVAVGP